MFADGLACFVFQRQPLIQNASAGTIISNQSLVLQSVSRARAGMYTCVAYNQEGDGESNPVRLDVKCEYEDGRVLEQGGHRWHELRTMVPPSLTLFSKRSWLNE